MRYSCYCLIIIISALITACSSQLKPAEKAKPIVIPKAQFISIKPDSVKEVTIREADLKAWVDELNMRLTLYDSILFKQTYSLQQLSKFKLTELEVDSLRTADNSETGDVSNYYVAAVYQKIIYRLLQKILTHPHIQEYNLSDIIDGHVTASDDGKLYLIHLSENTGGGYKTSLSWMHYRDEKGKIHNTYPEQLTAEKDTAMNPTFGNGSFTFIKKISTKTGIKYIMQGYTATCTTCADEYIQLVNFKMGEPIVDFYYSISYRTYNDEGDVIYFDQQNKVIRVAHQPNADYFDACECNGGETDNILDTERQPTETEDTDAGIRHGKSLVCVFRFNGETFVLDKKRSRLPRL
jgi:hypothetical protein